MSMPTLNVAPSGQNGDAETNDPAWARATSKALAAFAEVHPREIVTALLMTVTVFLLLTSYYLLKVVREPLILKAGGAEVKSYAAVGQAALMVLTTRAYAWLTSRLPRMRLTVAVYVFFAICIAAFEVLALADVPIGVPFYLFVGVFSLTVISQFWSFANDIYSPAQGKRLFAIIGIGSSVGAAAGAWIAGHLFGALGVAGLLVLAVVILLLSLMLLGLIDRREKVSPDVAEAETKTAAPSTSTAASTPSSTNDEGKFDHYLWLVAALTLLLNWVNTTGEYILDRTLLEFAQNATDGRSTSQVIGEFRGDFFLWVNLIGVGLQLFVASRVLKYIGVRGALFILPVIAFFGYSTMALVPILAAIKIAKIAENSVDYSIQSTTKQALFLVTTQQQKYRAKNVIDTFVVRAGDVCAAGVIALGAMAQMPTKAFIALNLLLVIGCIGVAAMLRREHQKKSDRIAASEGEPAGAI